MNFIEIKHLYIFFILFLNSVFGQEHVLKKEIIGANDSIGVQFVKLYVDILSNISSFMYREEYYFQWNNGNDSIQLYYSRAVPYFHQSDFDNREAYQVDSCKITTKQLDKNGLPEIIIEHSTSEWRKTTIVNLDSRKIMFSAINYSSVSYEVHDATPRSNPDQYFSSCNYSYEISFDKNDNLVIHNLQQKGGLPPIRAANSTKKNNYLDVFCHPDKKEGTYIIEDGVYIYS